MNEKDVMEKLSKITEEALKIKSEADWEIFLEEKINNDFFIAIQELLNLYDKEKLKNQFIISENIEDLYEKAAEKVMGKHISNVLLKGGIPQDYLNELVDKYENEIKNDGPLTKLDTYSTLRAVINDLEELIEEPVGLNSLLEEG